MPSRIVFLAPSVFLFIVTHAQPALALHVTRDSFVFNAGHETGNTTAELSDHQIARRSG